MLSLVQVVDGGEPAELRAKLAAALPNAPKPEVQAVRRVLLNSRCAAKETDHARA